MKKSLAIIATTALVTTLAIPALAGLVGVQTLRNDSAAQSDNSTIAQLQVAAERATRDGRNGNKNNIEFARKNYEINRLIQRLKSGEQVDMSEIDQALEPVSVW
jgi:hypothetical protein